LGRVTRVAIALGSNIGDRAAHLEFAVSQLTAFLNAFSVSSWHDTAPVGVAAQPRFLNGAAVGEAASTPRELLGRLLAIERARGRERPFAGAPRTLDLDLVLFGDEIVSEAGLSVPHPRFRERRFVLEPLAEVAPAMIDPVTGRTIAQLLADLDPYGHQTI
jgi:2-amino-4-hydroxy-6-hydroxymethyldihydropteridine diphosphokinase